MRWMLVVSMEACPNCCDNVNMSIPYSRDQIANECLNRCGCTRPMPALFAIDFRMYWICLGEMWSRAIDKNSLPVDLPLRYVLRAARTGAVGRQYVLFHP